MQHAQAVQVGHARRDLQQAAQNGHHVRLAVRPPPELALLNDEGLGSITPNHRGSLLCRMATMSSSPLARRWTWSAFALGFRGQHSKFVNQKASD